MNKKEFRLSCGIPGQCNGYKITESIKKLLETQENRTICIPKERYTDSEDDETSVQELIEYLEGEINCTVHPKDGNGRESYISQMHLDENGNIIVTVYDYYAAEFRQVVPCAFDDPKDLMRFAMENAKFDAGEIRHSAGELTEEQLNALDDFVKAAKALNDCGVTLFWNDDENALCAINRDAMREGLFFSYDDVGAACDKETESVYANMTSAIDVEVTYISKDIDYLYYPKTKE